MFRRFFVFLRFDKCVAENAPLLLVVSFDGERVITGALDDYVEHNILLAKAGLNSLDIDKYFRIVLDKSGADWTFVCPRITRTSKTVTSA